jgi:hypothetical protein
MVDSQGVPLDPNEFATPRTARSIFLDGRHATAHDLGAFAAMPDATDLRISGLRIGLRALADVPWIRHLTLNDPTTLDGLEALQQIRKLDLYDVPKIRDLSSIGALGELTSLRLSTPPSYDASRKCFEVESLDALARLGRLEDLTMRGIVPLRGRLEPLRALTQLRRIEITHVYSFGLEDYARLALALTTTVGHCLQPFFEASWAGPCPRGCGQTRVALTGPRPRSPRVLCADCNRVRLDKHVAAWRAVAAGPGPTRSV